MKTVEKSVVRKGMFRAIGEILRHPPNKDIRFVTMRALDDSSSGCYLCGAEATTDDHIPPQGFFEVLPLDMITVRACRECNQRMSKHEEYFRALVVGECYERSDIARRIWDGPVVRSLWKRGFAGLRLRLLKQSSLIGLPNGVLRTLFFGEGDRVVLVIRKIFRGLYFKLKKKRVSNEDLIIFRDVDVRIDLERLTRSWSEIDLGEVFRCRYQFDGNDGAMWIQFYRAVWWLAMIGEPARKYVSRSPVQPVK